MLKVAEIKNEYPNANAVSKAFLYAAALGLLVLAGDGLLIGFARIGAGLGIAEEWAQFTFMRGRGIHLQLIIFAWLSMALMGAMYYVVPRMVGRDLVSALAGKAHLVLQILGTVLIVGSLHYGYTEGREYLEPILPLDLAVVIVWVLFAGNIFTTIIKSRPEKVSPGLKFIGLSILYLGLNFVIANFIPLHGVRDDLMVYTFAHNEVNGWFMLGLIGLMYWSVPRLLKVKEEDAISSKVSNAHFWMLAVLIPPGVLHHFLYAETPVIEIWKQIGMWSSVAMLAPTFIWVYVVHRIYKQRQTSLGIAGGFYFAAMAYYLLNCVQGAAQSVIAINHTVHQTQWIAGHAHLALVGWISMGVLGVSYQLIPKLAGRELNVGLGKAHLWLANIGFIGMWITLSTAGILEAGLDGQAHVVIEETITPYLIGRFVFGTTFALGALVYAYNVYATATTREVATDKIERPVQVA